MNIATNYLGFHLRSPVVPSASPLTERLDNVKRLEDAGAGAIVFHSLFEEQLNPEGREIISRIEPGDRKRHGIDHLFPATVMCRSLRA